MAYTPFPGYAGDDSFDYSARDTYGETDIATVIIQVTIPPVGMVPDSNHDGKIDGSDKGVVTDEKPWSFWLNDDDDQHTDPLGPQNADCKDGHVNGPEDLKDFF